MVAINILKGCLKNIYPFTDNLLTEMSLTDLCSLKSGILHLFLRAHPFVGDCSLYVANITYSIMIHNKNIALFQKI